jgi:hypothetical protein
MTTPRAAINSNTLCQFDRRKPATWSSATGPSAICTGAEQCKYEIHGYTNAKIPQRRLELNR